MILFGLMHMHFPFRSFAVTPVTNRHLDIPSQTGISGFRSPAHVVLVSDVPNPTDWRETNILHQGKPSLNFIPANWLFQHRSELTGNTAPSLLGRFAPLGALGAH